MTFCKSDFGLIRMLGRTKTRSNSYLLCLGLVRLVAGVDQCTIGGGRNVCKMMWNWEPDEVIMAI
ncbi:MAG: hypothetical protein ACYS0I_02390 [Planctomycetota bacterium]|jgi:hypothetical protein